MSFLYDNIRYYIEMILTLNNLAKIYENVNGKYFFLDYNFLLKDK